MYLIPLPLSGLWLLAGQRDCRSQARPRRQRRRLQGRPRDPSASWNRLPQCRRKGVCMRSAMHGLHLCLPCRVPIWPIRTSSACTAPPSPPQYTPSLCLYRPLLPRSTPHPASWSRATRDPLTTTTPLHGSSAARATAPHQTAWTLTWRTQHRLSASCTIRWVIGSGLKCQLRNQAG